jgi:DNA-binding LacI/PurR family transcriptional regulator
VPGEAAVPSACVEVPTVSRRTATIQDVALLAGTSASTVSNLLNGRVNRMRPETRLRIERAMDQLGYRANEVARHLKTGHSPIIGLVIPSVANPFWGSFAQYVEEAALTHGYQVLLGNSGRDPERELRYAESLSAHGVRGVIFGSSPLSLNYILRLVDHGIRVVVFDRSLRRTDPAAQSGIDSVTLDNVAGGYEATKHLTALGHRRVGFLSGPLHTSSRLERLDGYRNALIDAGIRPDPNLVWADTTRAWSGDVEGAEIGREGARVLLGGPDRPTALVTINDMYALGALAGARDLGLSVPHDVSVIGFDDIPLASIAQPPLTTIRQPLPQMMKTAVDTLVGRLEGTLSGPSEHVTVASELIVRGSTAPPSGNPATPTTA